MKILEQDIETIKRFIQVAPIEVIRQFKTDCDNNPDNEKVKQIKTDLDNRLTA